MNLIQALESGKQFKRKHWSGWAKRTGEQSIVWCINNIPVLLHALDILSDDYEVEENYDLARKILLEIDKHAYGYATGGKEINEITYKAGVCFMAGFNAANNIAEQKLSIAKEALNEL